MPILRLSQISGFQNLKPAASASGLATNMVSGSQYRKKWLLRRRTRNTSVNRSGKLSLGKIANQSLLDDLLCLSRVVVPIARYFSKDSYGGSVITRSTDSDGNARSHATASPCAR